MRRRCVEFLAAGALAGGVCVSAGPAPAVPGPLSPEAREQVVELIARNAPAIVLAEFKWRLQVGKDGGAEQIADGRVPQLVNHGTFGGDLKVVFYLDGAREPGADGFVLLLDFNDTELACRGRCQGVVKTEMRYTDVVFVQYQQQPFAFLGGIFNPVDD